MFDQLKDKKGIFVFSDPAGAKACLAAAASLNQNEILVISDREYLFFYDFKVLVNSVIDKSIKSWIDSFEPEFIFTGTSLPKKIELDFIKEALHKNIKTISFVDHWINIKMRFFSTDEYIYPNEIWLIDVDAKQKAMLEGIPENLIRISGNPYYKFLKNWKPELSKKEVLKKIGADKFSRYILYAPEPFSTFNLQEKYGFDELSGLKHLDSALFELGLTDILIVVKGHPNQNSQIFLDYIKKTNSKNISYVYDFDINHLISYATVVIGYFSNSLIEAQEMNKKVIRILIDLIDINMDPFLNKEVGFKIYNVKSMRQKLNNIIN